MWMAYVLALCNLTAVKSHMVLTSLYAVELGAGAIATGTLFATYAVAPIVLGVYAGRVVDSAGMRLPMLAGSAGMLMAVVLPYFFRGLPALFASAGLLGSAYVFYHVGVQNLVGALSTKETRTRNFANYSLATTVPYLIGPLATGLLIERGGHALAYVGIAALPMLATVLLLSASQRIPDKRHAAPKTIGSPLRELLRNQRLLRMATLSGLALTSVDLFLLYAPIHARNAGLTAATIGIVLSFYSVAAVAVRFFLARLSRMCGNEERLLVVALAAATLAYVGFGSSTHPWILGLMAASLGAGLGCAQPLSLVLTYSYASQGRTAEGLGLRLMVNNGAHLVLPLAFGVLSSTFGLLIVFWANAGILAGSAAVIARPPRTRPKQNAVGDAVRVELKRDALAGAASEKNAGRAE